MSLQRILLLICPMTIHGTPKAQNARPALRGASNFAEVYPACRQYDIPNWHNGYTDCYKEVPSDSGTTYCSSEGWTCEGYEWHGWCQNGEIHYAGGAQFNYPERNCCACGKPFTFSASYSMENVSNSSADAVLVTANSSTEACPGCRQCAAESDWCSETLPCCDANARCESLVGGLGAKCLKQSQGCVAEEAVCGGHGMLTQQCCGDLQCQWRGDKMRCVSMDTPNWHNGYNDCYTEVPKESGTKYCSSEGWTCEGYEWHGWCQDGEIHYGGGAQFNYPERNCCACGKACSGGSGSFSTRLPASNMSKSSTNTSFLP